MKKIFLLLMAALLFIPWSTNAQLQISTDTKIYWYKITSPAARANGGYLTIVENDGDMLPKFNPLNEEEDAFFWKIVQGEGGYRIVNKVNDYTLTGVHVTRTSTRDGGTTKEVMQATVYNETDAQQIVSIETKDNCWILNFINKANYKYADIYSTWWSPLETYIGFYSKNNDGGNDFTFELVPDENTKLITTSTTSVNFGNIPITASNNIQQTISISCIGLQEEITYEFTNEQNAFAITETSWNAASGGDLKIDFKAKETVGTYSATLTFKSSGADNVTVNISAKTVELLRPILSSSDGSSDIWYYIASARGKTVLTDLGIGTNLVCQFPQDGIDGQLWKLVGTDYNDFKLINKLGHELDYVSNLYTISENSTRSFKLKPSIYNYASIAIGAVFVLDDNTGSCIDKRNDGPGFGQWGATDSDGTALTFILAKDFEYTYPRFSSDNETYWYNIQFVRRSTKLVQDNGIGSVVTQEITDGSLKTEQLFKFVGTLDGFKIISSNGNFWSFGTDRVTMSDETNAHTFKFATCSDKFLGVGLQDTQVSSENGHLNDNGATQIGTWYQNDQGNALKFIPVSVNLTWQGASEDWNTATNWDKNIVPFAGSSITIPANTTPPVLSANTTIANLVIKEGAEINLNGNTLNVTGNVIVERTAALNDNKEWLPIGFPFAATAHCFGFVVNTDWTSDLNPAGGYDYWLRTHSYNDNKHDFSAEANSISANTAYIAQFPNYHVEGDTPGENAGPGYSKISFVSDGAVEFSKKELTTATTYTFAANYNPYSIPVTANDDNNYWLYNAGSNSFQLVTENKTIQPFESFIIKTKESGDISVPTSIRLEADDFTNIEDVISDETIVDTFYFNLQGVKIQKPTETGIFIVKEILNSGEERTHKIVNVKK